MHWMQRIRYEAAGILIGAECTLWVKGSKVQIEQVFSGLCLKAAQTLLALGG